MLLNSSARTNNAWYRGVSGGTSNNDSTHARKKRPRVRVRGVVPPYAIGPVLVQVVPPLADEGKVVHVAVVAGVEEQDRRDGAGEVEGAGEVVLHAAEAGQPQLGARWPSRRTRSTGRGRCTSPYRPREAAARRISVAG